VDVERARVLILITTTPFHTYSLAIARKSLLAPLERGREETLYGHCAMGPSIFSTRLDLEMVLRGSRYLPLRQATRRSRHVFNLLHTLLCIISNSTSRAAVNT
jgi:hypothetical protein